MRPNCFCAGAIALILICARNLFIGAFTNAGQLCFAMKRIYVHEKIYNAVLDAFVAFAKNVKVGNPVGDASVGVGPVQNKQQYDIVLCVISGLVVPSSSLRRPHLIRSTIEDCKKNGYKFAIGGEVNKEQKGYFVPITVVDNPPEDSQIVQRERA